jgi:hypothetical protein
VVSGETFKDFAETIGPKPETSSHPFKTICCVCKRELTFRPSLAMQCGMNSGHLTCPGCKTFLHIEIMEGDRANSEKWDDYLARENYGPSGLLQFAETRNTHRSN